MAENPQAVPYPLAPDDRVMPVMVYMINSVARGEMVIKQTIRISTWFKSATPSDYLNLHRAHVLSLAGTNLQSFTFPDYFIPAHQIIGAHILPPAQEPLDYDPSEPNRKMESLAILFGSFRGNANIRMAATTNLGTFLSTSKETFLSLYDAEVSNPLIPNMGVLRAPILIVRPSQVFFALKPAA